MVAMYFEDVSSTSFSGIVQKIQVPTNHQQWRRLLQKRFDDLITTQRQHLHSKGHHHPQSYASVVVKPMSKRLEEINEDSEDYLESQPDYTPHPNRCKPQYEWQTQTYPTCNSIHERTMMSDRFSLYPSSIADHEHHDNIKDDGTNVLKPPKNLHHGGGANEGFFVHGRRLGEQQQQYQSHDHATSKIKTSKAFKKKQKEHEQLLQQQYKLLGHGYWRDTWMFQRAMPATAATTTTTRKSMRQPLVDDSHRQQHQQRELVAFKTTKYNHDLSEYVLDKQRRDSVTSDRLQFSDHSIKMYAYCGSSAMYEWAPGGDMESFIESYETPQQFVEEISLEERFQLAYNVTMALNDLHTTEGSDRPAAIVHADFRADQFVSVTPVDWQTGIPQIDNNDDPQHPKQIPQFKLGDFNLARFPYWNTKFNHPCTIETEADGGEFRAPEEYSEEFGITEKLDIYSLGNLLYTLLTGHWPFDDMEGAEDSGATRKMKKMVKKGERPRLNIDADYTHDPDPRVQALVQAIHWCWEQDPHDRPTAQQVEDLLAEQLPKGVLQRHHDRRHGRPLFGTL